MRERSVAHEVGKRKFWEYWPPWRVVQTGLPGLIAGYGVALPALAKLVNSITGVQLKFITAKSETKCHTWRFGWDEKSIRADEKAMHRCSTKCETHIEVYNGWGAQLVRHADPQPKQEHRSGDPVYVISIASNTLSRKTKKQVPAA